VALVPDLIGVVIGSAFPDDATNEGGYSIEACEVGRGSEVFDVRKAQGRCRSSELIQVVAAFSSLAYACLSLCVQDNALWNSLELEE
jgi:hypothetical protein